MIGPSLFFCLNFFFLMAAITWTAIHLAQHYNYSPQNPVTTLQQGQLSKIVASRSTTPRKMEEGVFGKTESTIEKIDYSSKLSTTSKPATIFFDSTKILSSSTTTPKTSTVSSSSSTKGESLISLEVSSSQKPRESSTISKIISTTQKSTSTTFKSTSSSTLSSSSTEKKPSSSLNDETGENVDVYFKVEKPSSDGTSKIIASGIAKYDENNVLIIDPVNEQTTRDDLSYLLSSTNETSTVILSTRIHSIIQEIILPTSAVTDFLDKNKTVISDDNNNNKTVSSFVEKETTIFREKPLDISTEKLSKNSSTIFTEKPSKRPTILTVKPLNISTSLTEKPINHSAILTEKPLNVSTNLIEKPLEISTNSMEKPLEILTEKSSKTSTILTEKPTKKTTVLTEKPSKTLLPLFQNISTINNIPIIPLKNSTEYLNFIPTTTSIEVPPSPINVSISTSSLVPPEVTISYESNKTEKKTSIFTTNLIEDTSKKFYEAINMTETSVALSINKSSSVLVGLEIASSPDKVGSVSAGMSDGSSTVTGLPRVDSSNEYFDFNGFLTGSSTVEGGIIYNVSHFVVTEGNTENLTDFLMENSTFFISGSDGPLITGISGASTSLEDNKSSVESILTSSLSSSLGIFIDGWGSTTEKTEVTKGEKIGDGQDFFTTDWDGGFDEGGMITLLSGFGTTEFHGFEVASSGASVETEEYSSRSTGIYSSSPIEIYPSSSTGIYSERLTEKYSSTQMGDYSSTENTTETEKYSTLSIENDTLLEYATQTEKSFSSSSGEINFSSTPIEKYSTQTNEYFSTAENYSSSFSRSTEIYSSSSTEKYSSTSTENYPSTQNTTQTEKYFFLTTGNYSTLLANNYTSSRTAENSTQKTEEYSSSPGEIYFSSTLISPNDSITPTISTIIIEFKNETSSATTPLISTTVTPQTPEGNNTISPEEYSSTSTEDYYYPTSHFDDFPSSTTVVGFENVTSSIIIPFTPSIPSQSPEGNNFTSATLVSSTVLLSDENTNLSSTIFYDFSSSISDDDTHEYKISTSDISSTVESTMTKLDVTSTLRTINLSADDNLTSVYMDSSTISTSEFFSTTSSSGETSSTIFLDKNLSTTLFDDFSSTSAVATASEISTVNFSSIFPVEKISTTLVDDFLNENPTFSMNFINSTVSDVSESGIGSSDIFSISETSTKLAETPENLSRILSTEILTMSTIEILTSSTTEISTSTSGISTAETSMRTTGTSTTTETSTTLQKSLTTTLSTNTAEISSTEIGNSMEEILTSTLETSRTTLSTLTEIPRTLSTITTTTEIPSSQISTTETLSTSPKISTPSTTVEISSTTLENPTLSLTIPPIATETPTLTRSFLSRIQPTIQINSPSIILTSSSTLKPTFPSNSRRINSKIGRKRNRKKFPLLSL